MTKKDFELLANILGSIEFVKTSKMTRIVNTLARTYPSFNKDKFAKAYLERANACGIRDISPKEIFVFPDNDPPAGTIIRDPQDEETRVGYRTDGILQWTDASGNQLSSTLLQALYAEAVRSAAERTEAEARLELMEYLR